MAPAFYNFKPYKDCIQAIGSKIAADGSPCLAGAPPVSAGDETTWPVGGLLCRRSLAERPHEEERTRAALCVEYGVVTPVTLSHGGMTSPSRKKRRQEPKLQGLPERASTSSRRPRHTPDPQVVRSCRIVAGEVEAALEEESGAARAPAHQISTSLATEVGRRRRRR
jgi:hypothetical protein